MYYFHNYLKIVVILGNLNKIFWIFSSMECSSLIGNYTLPKILKNSKVHLNFLYEFILTLLLSLNLYHFFFYLLIFLKTLSNKQLTYMN